MTPLGGVTGSSFLEHAERRLQERDAIGRARRHVGDVQQLGELSLACWQGGRRVTEQLGAGCHQRRSKRPRAGHADRRSSHR